MEDAIYNDDNEEEEEKEEEESEDRQEEKQPRLKTLYEIAKGYIFTPDIYLKMILILLRIRANIPVIMMGETGIGKTSLIKKLSEFLNNGDKKKLKIL